MPASTWMPRHRDAIERLQDTQNAWSEVDDVVRERARHVVLQFRAKGTPAGLRAARHAGMTPAATLYLRYRAASEEELARKLADLIALRTRRPSPGIDDQIAILELRLDEVRDAMKLNVTPRQAVADKPELVKKSVHWTVYAALGLSAAAIIRSFTATKRSS